MKATSNLIAVSLALAVNAAAVAALNQSMTAAGERAQLAAEDPVRMVVSARKAPAELAGAQCATPKAL